MLYPAPNQYAVGGTANDAAAQVPNRLSGIPRPTQRDTFLITPPSVPYQDQGRENPPGSEPVDRARIPRVRVRMRMGMLKQNIPQAGRTRKPMTNRAEVAARQYPAPFGPLPTLDRNSPDNYLPWQAGTRLDLARRAPAERVE